MHDSRLTRRILIAALAVFCVLPSSLAIAQARGLSGVSLPQVVNVNGKDLALNGSAIARDRVVFEVYVIGLYLETKTSDALTAIKIDQTKRIVITMLRSVSRRMFVDAVEKRVTRNSTPEEMPGLRLRLDTLEEALPDLKKGDILDFTYLPGAGTLVRRQGQELAIPGKDFAEALFSAWLGREPDSRALKRDLLGLGVTPASCCESLPNSPPRGAAEISPNRR